MAKRTPLALTEIASASPEAAPSAETESSPAATTPAPAPTTKPVTPQAAVELTGATATVFARVPWSLAEGLKDLARERSRLERRRVTNNELVEEALTLLLARKG